MILSHATCLAKNAINLASSTKPTRHSNSSDLNSMFSNPTRIANPNVEASTTSSGSSMNAFTNPQTATGPGFATMPGTINTNNHANVAPFTINGTDHRGVPSYGQRQYANQPSSEPWCINGMGSMEPSLPAIDNHPRAPPGAALPFGGTSLV